MRQRSRKNMLRVMAAGQEPFSLYLHIPYCVRKCPYCDFNVQVVRKIPEPEYTQALARELKLHAQSDFWRGRSLLSIFFGGGTPSVFTPGSIGGILETIVSFFRFEPDIEISLEANPDREDSKHFPGYRSRGVNRLSLGAQSFQPHLLQFLGRLHTAEDTRDALRAIRRAGFENFSLDLIYGSPGQSLADLRSDLQEALNFTPPHVSAYNLTIEEKTVFHRLYREGKIVPLSEEEEIAMAGLVEAELAGAGLERYEISNYARPGRDSKHNVNYWQGGDYLGVGAGAHSYKRLSDVGGQRWHNEKHPRRYMERIAAQGSAVTEEEKTDLRQSAAEFMFLGLRMTRGVLVAEFSRRFGKNPGQFYPQISAWLEEGLIEEKGDRLRLTRRGLMVANSIFVEFV
ncbi:MAG: radical SAM family heme chaperone HemW [Deltaproteobacteria bacterium]|nr:radical SAM family heme chaperone HemW [Deltaproteobacteria bacterium]